MSYSEHNLSSRRSRDFVKCTTDTNRRFQELNTLPLVDDALVFT